MTDAPIPRLSPEDTNPASDLKTDIVQDVDRDDTITSDVTGPRKDEMPDDSDESQD